MPPGDCCEVPHERRGSFGPGSAAHAVIVELSQVTEDVFEEAPRLRATRRGGAAAGGGLLSFAYRVRIQARASPGASSIVTSAPGVAAPPVKNSRAVT